jgi:hypothetical protein
LSEIRANTVSNAAGTGPVTLTGQSASKAWVDGNGTGTVSIDASFNISTMTDNGTGQYTFSFTNAFSSTAYCPQATGRGDATGEGSWNTSTRTPAATSCATSCYNTGGSFQDQTALSWSALGDLA